MQRDQSRHLKISGNKIRSPTSLLTATASSTRNVIILFLFFTLLVGALITARWNTSASMISTSVTSSTISQISKPHKEVAKSKPPPPLALMPLTCTTTDPNATYICPSPPSQTTGPLSPSPSCPDYFRWIHEDLRPWKNTGITRELVERARETATFRLVVLNGRAYFEKYQEAFQTRDVFTLWGILQLLRRYPGRVPDLDIMFDCVDWPVIVAEDYLGEDKPAPPPLFRYCGNDSTLDIVFPDWSFWGWPEINIKPWGALLGELKEGNKRVKWLDREPYAYWKGNPAVAETRMELVKCNVSEGQDWNARIYTQDWLSETKTGFKQSDLASQCIHRYKIYIEGSAWSVSEKYILACNSLSLLVTPHYYDFFTRSLMPLHHYWPIREDDKCRSVKFAVNWGNSHKQKARAMGNAASTFIQEDLKMDYVYDYMFHLLSEYAKLLKYKPTRPPEAIELCSESMACPAEGTKREFMMESMVKAAHGSQPCSMPPPYSSAQLEQLLKRKAQSIKQVEMWEQRASQSKSN